MRSGLLLCFLTIFAMHCSSGKVADGSTDGATIFKEACARCHGGDGVPTKGMAARTGVKPLNSERVLKVLSDEELRKQILNGSRSKTMPAFQGALSDEQVTAVIAHVRYLGTLTRPATVEQPGKPVQPETATPPADPAP